MLIMFAGCAALFRPWIGINSYYLLAILGPQYIWWWNFQGLRVSFIIALATIIGFTLELAKGNYDYSFLFNKKNYWLFVLWAFIVLSYYQGPYVSGFSSAGLGPSRVFSITNTIFFFYFLSTLEINSLKKIRFLIIIFVVSTLYLTYWANNQYLSQNWYQFNWGRLMGPFDIYGGSIYKDENAFAMLFATGLPFVYYLGWELKNRILRWFLWAMIPLGWHAIFLTGSRGGLVALGSVMVCVLLLSNRKLLVIPLLVLFMVFYQWQAGSVMTQRSQMIVEYEGEGSAEMRIAAWTGGYRMILDHPIFGVGLASFITALPDYYETSPRVAHNTFVQYAAESGIVAGLAYLIVVYLFFKQSFKIRAWCRKKDGRRDVERIDLYNNACTASFAGLFVCGLFLSLNTYEIFFVLLLINNCLLSLVTKEEALA